MPEEFSPIFSFEVEAFEKAGEDKTSRRIGGYATTESLDRQGEIIVQKGLDFSDFLKSGWFNDNHKQGMSNVIGYPISAEFHKGKGWYVEGYLIKGFKPADEIWDLAKALQGTPRKLGFSVEGKIIKRVSNRIAKAVVKHIAVTHVPVNTDCTIEILAKSFCSNAGEDECKHCGMCKALEAGHAANPLDGSMTGGSALRKQDLDKKLKILPLPVLEDEEAIATIIKRGFPEERAGEILTLLKNPLTLGRLLSIGGN